MVVDGRQKDVHVGVGVFSESGIVIQGLLIILLLYNYDYCSISVDNVHV